MYNIVTNNIFFYLVKQKDIASIAVWMLYPKIIQMHLQISSNVFFLIITKKKCKSSKNLN